MCRRGVLLLIRAALSPLRASMRTYPIVREKPTGNNIYKPEAYYDG
jgi:hypothetical protein